MTGQIFLELIDACDIELVLSSSIAKGCYYYCEATLKHVIVLSTRIKRDERSQVGWHEFAHFLQNYRQPAVMKADYCESRNRAKAERFADLFAFVCVTGIPICGRMDFLETLMTSKWR